jgi:hypothetical protein
MRGEVGPSAGRRIGGGCKISGLHDSFIGVCPGPLDPATCTRRDGTPRHPQSGMVLIPSGRTAASWLGATGILGPLGDGVNMVRPCLAR